MQSYMVNSDKTVYLMFGDFCAYFVEGNRSWIQQRMIMIKYSSYFGPIMYRLIQLTGDFSSGENIRQLTFPRDLFDHGSSYLRK